MPNRETFTSVKNKHPCTTPKIGHVNDARRHRRGPQEIAAPSAQHVPPAFVEIFKQILACTAHRKWIEMIFV